MGSALVRLFVPLLLFASVVSAEGLALYWTDRTLGAVRRGDPATGAVLTLVEGLPGPQGIAVDPVEGRLYWADTTARTIMRCWLDGSGVELVVAVDGFPKGLDFDPEGRALYWADPVLRTLTRHSLETGETRVAASGIGIPQDVRYDARSNRVVWVETEGIFSLPVAEPARPASEARAATLDFVGQTTVFAIAEDRARVYWGAAQKLRSSGLFGDCFERLDPVIGTVKGIDYDAGSERLYWIEEEGGAIYSMSIDGGAIELVFAGEPEPWRLAAGPSRVAPRIVEQPTSKLVAAGGTAELRVTATGGGGLEYQWQRDGEPLEESVAHRGVRGPTLRIEGFGAEDVGRYVCVVASGGGVAASDPAVLGLDDPPAGADDPMARLWQRMLRVIEAGGD